MSPRHLLRVLTPVLLLAGLLVGAAGTPAQARDLDCSDFSSQADAQHYFVMLGGPSYDPDRLDGDGDGVACDTLDCPCSTSTSTTTHTTTTTTSTTKTTRQRARIVDVVDGDTVDVRILPGGPRSRVRLLGIDTPEVYGGVECGGRAASRFTKRTLPPGTVVTLVSDPTQANKDRYGRLLRYVMKSGTDVNRRIVRQGHATVYVYGGKRFQRASGYYFAQRQARRHDLGIWHSCR